jgi:hypothetical protein
VIRTRIKVAGVYFSCNSARPVDTLARILDTLLLASLYSISLRDVNGFIYFFTHYSWLCIFIDIYGNGLHAGVFYLFLVRKCLHHPQPMRCGLHNLPTYEMVYSTSELSKNQSNYPLRQFFKNHSKSQKNHKMKILIVLDSKWVNLYNEHIICYALVHFFTAMKKNIKYSKAYHIIYSICRFTHLESNTIRFFILWFFCDLLCFFQKCFRV